jgi:molybdopterin synthase catalytic subunit
MEMKSPSSLPLAEDKVSFLSHRPLSLAFAVQSVESKEFGAVVTFSGCVRDTEKEEAISAIHYDVYEPMAELEFGKIAREAETRWPVKSFVQHRIGRVPVMEASVIVACAAPHRKEAFEACEFIVEQLKANVPIWKVRYEK